MKRTLVALLLCGAAAALAQTITFVATHATPGGGGAGITREWHWAATEGTTSVTTGGTNPATRTWTDAQTLTFTPTANADYLICGFWEAEADTGGHGLYRLNHDTASAEKMFYVHRAASSSEVRVDGACTIYEAPASPASQTWSIEISDYFNFLTQIIGRRRLFALKLETGDEWSMLGSEFTTTSDTYSDAHTLTFTASADDYLILVVGEGDIDGTVHPFVQLDVDGTTYYADSLLTDRGNSPNDGYRMHIWMPVVASLTSGSRTVALEMRTSTAGQQVGVKRATIVALPLSGFEEAFYVQDHVGATNTTTTYATYQTDTNTLTAGADYWVIGGSSGYAPSGDSWRARLTHDSTVLNEGYYDANASTDERGLSAYGFVDEAVTGGSVTTLEEFRKVGTNTATMEGGVLAVLRLE